MTVSKQSQDRTQFNPVFWSEWPGYWHGHLGVEPRQENMILPSFLVLAIVYLLVVCVRKLFHLITLNYTNTHTHTFSRIPLDEESARRKGLCLTTHNNHKLQTSIPPAVFETTITGNERRQTHTLDRAAPGSAPNEFFSSKSFRPALWTIHPPIKW